MTYEFCSYKRAAYTTHIYYIIYITLSPTRNVLFSYKETIIHNIIATVRNIEPITFETHPYLCVPFVDLNIYISNAIINAKITKIMNTFIVLSSP